MFFFDKKISLGKNFSNKYEKNFQLKKNIFFLKNMILLNLVILNDSFNIYNVFFKNCF